MSASNRSYSCSEGINVAVLIPCYNESLTIGEVVRDFRTKLPNAMIYVYDNNSSDETAKIAAHEGAVVRSESLQGKGYVVSRMFSEIEADVYLLCDGDATYDVASAPELIHCLLSGQHDMVCGSRVDKAVGAYRPGHRWGNLVLTGLVAAIFGRQFRDMLTGYRVFSRRFVKSFPVLSSGFEIETQLTVHALEMQMRVAEVPTPYFERPPGSESKLSTFKDGWRILRTIFFLVKEERPLAFFSVGFLLLISISLMLAFPVVREYMATGLVPRFPTAILSTGLALLAFLSLSSGLILDTVSHGRREVKRLFYLALAPLPVMQDYINQKQAGQMGVDDGND
jgi:glycosyltransferase involved in cell wall biosynthesis